MAIWIPMIPLKGIRGVQGNAREGPGETLLAILGSLSLPALPLDPLELPQIILRCALKFAKIALLSCLVVPLKALHPHLLPKRSESTNGKLSYLCIFKVSYFRVMKSDNCFKEIQIVITGIAKTDPHPFKGLREGEPPLS